MRDRPHMSQPVEAPLRQQLAMPTPFASDLASRQYRLLVQRGFTLIELITVMVLIGVLSVYAVPRMIDTVSFFARGFHDETLALLRYAQKAAIAQRRTVCVAFTGSSASLSIASQPAVASCDTALTGPKGETPATVTAKTGVSYSGTPTGFNFNGQGQPVDSSGVALVATQTIAIVNASNVMVEAGTGYVHE